MKSIKIIAIGNLGADPEMKYLPSGQPITTFSLASNHSYTTASGERKQETEWLRCSAFGKLAETCNQYLTKGQQVFIEGRVKLRTYNSKAVVRVPVLMSTWPIFNSWVSVTASGVQRVIAGKIWTLIPALMICLSSRKLVSEQGVTVSLCSSYSFRGQETGFYAWAGW
jgi:hypothetical protein